MVMAVSAKRFFKPLVRKFALRRELRKADVVVVSIKKSGRTWLRAMLTRLYHSVYETPTNLLLDGSNHTQINPAAPSVLFAHDSDPVASANDVTADLSIYDGMKVILLVRNPADIVVSLYHHYRNRKTGKRQKLASEADIYEFSTRPNHGIHTIISFLNNWAQYSQENKNVVVIRYEDLSADAAIQLQKVAKYAGIDASPDQLRNAISFASIENLRKLETEGFFDHISMRKTDPSKPEALKVRRGRVSGYKDYFTDAQCREIEQLVIRNLDPSFGYQKMLSSQPNS